MTSGSLAAGFEPQIAFVFPSPRLAYMFLALVYDRSVAGEDERAMACHDSILEQLMAAGYQPYRLGIHSMATGFTADGDYAALMKRLKVELDPQGILAPGRYEFG
jgi:4-cresol dehydrogenase (hydroxylating)